MADILPIDRQVLADNKEEAEAVESKETKTINKEEVVELEEEVEEVVADPKKEVFANLTDALEAFFHQTGFNGAFRLDPMDSKLYAIQSSEIEVKKEAPKVYSMYGEFRQGV